MNHEKKLSIKDWSSDDQPREKLLKKGKNVLSNAELIAILIGSGNNKESAIELSKKILDSVQNDLSLLSKMNAKELMMFRGIGEAKAVSIISALELGRRKKDHQSQKKQAIKSSADAYSLVRHLLEDLDHEEFWVLFLNRANQEISKHQISSGGQNATIVDPKIIFKLALEYKSSGIILFHNHPSGNLIASDSDKSITSKLVKAGSLLEINVLDHIIVGENNYFSFADEGII